ncbi:MAG: TonB-dependent receptor [Chitinophagales bacterium]|nr:TonB-dependent receptor [Chitinophagales bacterium]
MRQVLLTSSLFFLFIHLSFSQTATLKGTVKDGSTGELLESASVVQLPANGTTTDEKGNYELQVTSGNITIVVSYIGMKPDTQSLKVKEGEIKTLNITLGGSPVELQQVVIGENKIGVKMQKVTQSVDVMKPRLLEANNITNMQGAVNKIPGVTVLDGQMSIRGGSGYAYGSGSRVLLVIDEMPLMTADRGEIKWPFIPIENVEQMEVIKGASTMQYGSSALNGVLNVTTAYARDTPSTRMTFFYEGMGKPPVDSFQWWKRDGQFFNNPNTAGMSFLHKQKFGAVDFVIGGMLQGSQSHLNEEYDYFTRFNTKLRWQPKKLQRLTLELTTNLMYRKSGFQFYWKDGGHPYLSASGVDIDERYFYAFIDPKIRFVDKKNNQHKLYTRIFRQNNLDGQTDFWIFGVDYQFRHDFGKIFRILTGVRNEHWMVNDGTLGKHVADFGGGFVQGEVNYKWFSMNLGIREEYVRLDSAIRPTIPVVRVGMNFEIRKFNYIRASFGQAFRVPSIAERFVDYNLAGIRILPNPTVRPERGFTAELGYKRSLKIGNWLGYFDAVMFWTEFKDMIEFTFGTKFDNTGFYPYFQSQNVSKARIFGWELSTYGEGKIGPVDFTTLLGYTYFYGVDLNDTATTKNVGDFLGDAFTHFVLPTPKSEPANPSADYEVWDSLTRGMLKYRNPHTFKADFDFVLFDKYRFGTSIQYYGFMSRVDKIFEVFINDVKQKRQQRLNRGDVAWDLRAGYDFNRNITLNFLVKNVLNADYAIRIAKPDKPRTYTVQLVVSFGGSSKTVAQSRFNNI